MSLILREYKAQNFTGNSYTFDMDFLQAGEFLRSSGEDQKQNLDSYRMKAAFVLDPSIDTDLTQLKKEVDGYTYKIIVKGSNGKSPEFPVLASGSSFSVKSTGSGDGEGFSIKFEPPAPEYIPQDFIYNKIDGNWIIQGFRKQVDANEFAGLYFTEDVRDIKVKVGPIEVPISSIVKDLVVFGIPSDLPAGVHDVFIESTQGNLTLENAIEKISPAIPAYLEAGPPPSGNPGEYLGVRLFNIEGNDEARVYLNDNLIGTATSAEEVHIPLGKDTPNPLSQEQRNRICFELENNGGGYTYGFEIDGGELYREVLGTPGVKNVTDANGNEDNRQGVVVRQCMTMNRFKKPVGTPGQPFWAKVFNLTPGSTMTFRDGAYEDHVITASSPKNETSFEVPLYSPGNDDVELETITYHSNGETYYSEVWNSSYLNWNVQSESEQPATVGVEIYRGINLVYRHVEGQAGIWGAEDNEPDPYTLHHDFEFWFYPNLEPPNGWYDCKLYGDCY